MANVIQQMTDYKGTNNVFPITKATAVYDENGKSVNSRLGEIDSNLSKASNNINTMSAKLNTVDDNLTAGDNLVFNFATDGEGNYGYLKADGSFTPFSSDFTIPEMTFGDTDFAGGVVNPGGNTYAEGQMGSYGTGTFIFNCENYKYLHIDTIQVTKASWRGASSYCNATIALKDENRNALKKSDGSDARWTGSVISTWNNISNIDISNCKQAIIGCTFFASSEGESALVSLTNVIFSSSPR